MAGKVVGSLLILTACFCMGYRLSIRSRLRLEELESIKSAVIKLDSALEYERLTFIQALGRCADVESEGFFRSVYTALKNNNSVKTAWKYALEENSANSYMTSEDIHRLSLLGEGFESADADMRERCVKDCIDYIDSREEIIKPDIERDIKLYRSVSLTVGLFIVLLLI